MARLILLRHGQSEWNLENRFTGEMDIGLTVQGEQEAKKAGKLLKEFPIDIAYTSVLKRAIYTLEIVLKEIGRQISVVKSPALNERNYGELQGLNKAETAKKYGVHKVLLWRRSFSVRPPGGESLKDTFERVVPYYQKEIMPQLKANKLVLIVAHGNSLRALIMYLQKLDEQEISQVDVLTGIPFVYDFSPQMELIKMEYL
jgi:2,3-bisphosphoglycerate-dependent phosphoglycerate mutase